MVKKKESKPEPKPEPEPQIDLDFLYQLVLASKGGNPKAQAMLQEIFTIEELHEKTNFPTAINQQKQTYMLYCADKLGKVYGEPFRRLSKYDAQTWRSYKGFLFKAFEEMLKKGGGDLSGIMMPSISQPANMTEQKRRFWQGNKKKGLVGEVIEE